MRTIKILASLCSWANWFSLTCLQTPDKAYLQFQHYYVIEHPYQKPSNCNMHSLKMGAQWLSGRVFDSRPRSRGLEPHRRHCVVVLEQGTFILA